LINASKFSPENESIDIRANMLANAVRVVVRDHGIGVEAALQPFIFDLFTQGLRSVDCAQGGLGICLSLARSIVDMHGGTITVASASPALRRGNLRHRPARHGRLHLGRGNLHGHSGPSPP